MKTKQVSQFHIRQGDVLPYKVASMPPGCVEVPNDRGRIVLAYGEVTGHAHAIADIFYEVQHTGHHDTPNAVWRATPSAVEIANAAISRAKARLYQSPAGERYLEVLAPVTLRHEEHTEHVIPPGIYKLPVQVEYTPQAIRRVED